MNRRRFIQASALGIAGVSGCSTTSSSGETPVPIEKQPWDGDPPVKFSESTTTRGGGWFSDPSLEISGKVVAKMDLALLEIHAQFFDASNVRIAEAMDSVEDLRKNDAWRFTLVYPEDAGTPADKAVDWTFSIEWLEGS